VEFFGKRAGAACLAERQQAPSELRGLALCALQSAKDAKFPHFFHTFSCMFLGNVPVFYSCFQHSKVHLNIPNSSINMRLLPLNS
ncbi:hypothetical protein MTR67_037143, partial [Solanum verrucosum]